MKKEFCTYNQALALKELGFDEPCLLSLSWINGYNTYTENFNEPKAWISSNVEIKYDFSQFKIDFKDVYHVEIQIPLYQQTFRWFREKYNIQGYIYSSTVRGNTEKTKQFTGYIWNINGIDTPFLSTDARDELHDTYEEAESACLDKLIEIIKNK